jgi:hypothetical protein
MRQQTAEAINQGRVAWETLKERHKVDRLYWYEVGKGLQAILDHIAEQKGGTKASRREFGESVKRYGMGDMPQAARTSALWLYRHWNTIPWDRLTDINHPEAIRKQTRQVRQDPRPRREGPEAKLFTERLVQVLGSTLPVQRTGGNLLEVRWRGRLLQISVTIKQ